MVSVVVPAYNEERAIGGVLEELRSVVAKIPYRSEIIVVDDGSRDGTVAAVSALDGVRLIRNPVNLGYGHSLMRGIAASQGDIIAICDGDGSYDPGILKELLEQTRLGADHAIAQRTGPESRRPWLRRLAYRWLCQYVAGQRVPDANSGLRVFRRRLYEEVAADLCLGFSFTTSLTLASLMSGYIVVYVGMPYRSRIGRSHVRLRDILRTGQYLFQLIAAYNPVKLFLPLVVGVGLMSLGSFGAAIVAGGAWAVTGILLAAASILLVGLAANAYTVSRASAGPIRVARVLRRSPAEEPEGHTATDQVRDSGGAAL